MNKLIIIGNGFDLAHGLPTSYNHFLNHIWNKFSEMDSNKLIGELFSLDRTRIRLDSYDDYNDFIVQCKRNYNRNGYRTHMPENYNKCLKVSYQDPYMEGSPQCVFEFKNKLFELITANNIETWVDIEKIYYDALLSLVKADRKFSQFKSIDQLNSEFKQIKNLLNNYIKENVEDKYVFSHNYEQCKSIVDLFSNQYNIL